MKNLLLMIFFMCFGLGSKAQSFREVLERTGPDFNRGISIYFVAPSLMISSPSNINSLLIENGYPYIPRRSLNFGLGANYRMGRFEPGFEFTIGNQSIENPFIESELNRRPLTSNIFFNYHLFRLNSFTIYPFVGYSMTNTNLILSKLSNVDDFEELIQNPGTTVNLRHNSHGPIVGIGVSLAQHWVESTGTFRLKFAYRIPTNQGSSWESKFSNFNKTPLDSFPYFFVQLELGFLGNWSKGTPWRDRF